MLSDLLATNRERNGFTVGQVAWRLGISATEYRELEGRHACAAGVRASSAPKNSSASVTDIASTSLMSRPPRW